MALDNGEPPEADDNGPSAKKASRRKVPTSLVVTLLGIALTAWLLPAVTRQWDDRQRRTTSARRWYRE
jgi:hypothetical protein